MHSLRSKKHSTKVVTAESHIAELPLAVREYLQKFRAWEESFASPAQRQAYIQQVCDRIAATQQNRKAFDPPLTSHRLCSLHIIERGANLFPLFLKPEQKQHSLFEQPSDNEPQPNLSAKALSYLDDIAQREALGAQASRLLSERSDANEACGENSLKIKESPHEVARASLHSLAASETLALPGASRLTAELFFHAVAILHSPTYHTENAGALRQDWPRIPLPANKDLLLAAAILLLEPALEANYQAVKADCYDWQAATYNL